MNIPKCLLGGDMPGRESGMTVKISRMTFFRSNSQVSKFIQNLVDIEVNPYNEIYLMILNRTRNSRGYQHENINLSI